MNGANYVSSGPSIVEGEVRELVRRRGIDPVVEPDVVRRLIDDVIGEYLDRAVTSSLPPLGDPTHVSRAVLDAVAGFGPLQPFLDDRTIEEIWINDMPAENLHTRMGNRAFRS
jgi:pilus assembly protein CpaF